MKKKKYKLILLDADNTLLDYKKGEEKALRETLNQFHVNENINDYINSFKIINSDIWIELENGTITKEKLRIERFTRLFNERRVNINIKNFAEKYIGHLKGQSDLLQGAAEICAYLCAKKYTLSVITNGIKEVQCSRITKSKINKYIENIIVSEEAGFNKPHQGIFEYAFKISKYENKKNALIIGDSLSSDIKGGYNFGIDTCWFNPLEEKLTVDFKPTYIIKKLEELKEIL
ncbi:MAG: YjjG family noncanonical pyrimidine nucleotidase [Spirochaetes bacterium]|nr:YjjG family noncanonical pyrimidine nucleotidase [Spirochaetota bacterium]